MLINFEPCVDDAALSRAVLHHSTTRATAATVQGQPLSTTVDRDVLLGMSMPEPEASSRTLVTGGSWGED